MSPVLAVVWTFWIAVVLALSAVMAVITIALLYVKKVELPRYPRD
jgi:hypothetical protein